MTPRTLALAAAAVAVLGMGVYLFIEVRSTPAQAQGEPSEPHPTAAVSHAVPADTGPKWQPGPSAPGGSARPLDPVRPTEGPRPTVTADEATPDELLKANPRLDAVMDQANKAYDRQDFDEAKAIAGKVLVKQPDSVRMLRIMVSASCQDGDSTTAQTYFDRLPKPDREQMKVRCDRFGVSFKEPPQ